MNTSLLFWGKWPLGYKIWYSIIFILLLSCLCYMLYGWYVGADGIIPWLNEGELLTYPVVTGQFSSALFDVSTETDAFTIVEKFVAGSYPIRAWVYQLQVFLGCFSLVLILTSLTYIKPKLWYAGGLLTVLFFVGSANLDATSVAASDWLEFNNNKVVFVVFSVILVGTSFCMQSYQPFNYAIRLVFFAALFIGFGAYLELSYSKINHLSMYVSNYPTIMYLALMAVFVLLNGHEIMHLIFLATSQGSSKGNHNTPFLVFGGFYLVNMMLYYLESNNVLDWNLYYIPPTIVFAITAVLSVWGLKQRERSHYADVISFAPYGALLFIGIALFCTSNLGFAYASGNDSLVEAFEDVILYAHIGMAVAYVVYAMSNFSQELPENFDMKTYFWDAPKSDFVWSSFFGFFIVAIFLFRSDYFPYKQAKAAQNIGIADLYEAEGEGKLAEGFYRTAQGYDMLNHKGNYTLGLLYRKNNYQPESLPYFEAANRRKPSAYAQSHILDVLMKTSPQDADIRGKIALYEFPKSSELYNNLGVFMLQTAASSEQAYNYLLKATELAPKGKIQQANFFALWPAFNLKGLPTDVIKEPLPYSGTFNNELVYLTRIGQKSQRAFVPELIKDSVLQTADLCYLYSYALNKPEAALPLVDKLKAYEKVKSNESFVSFMAYARANIWFYNHNTFHAFMQMQTLADNFSSTDPKFYHTVGTWYQRFGQYKSASNSYYEAFRRMKLSESLNEAIALSYGAESRAKAIEKWQERATQAKDETALMARDMLKHLSPDSLRTKPLANRNDEEKYQYLHYNQYQTDLQAFLSTIKTISNINLKVKAILDRIFFNLQNEELKEALLLRNELTGVPGIQNELLAELRYADLHLLYRSNRLNELENLLKEVSPNLTQKGWVLFFQAVVSASKKRSTEANQLFEQALLAQPFEPHLYEVAAKHYNSQKLFDQSYNLYINGLDIIPNSGELYAAYTLQCLEQSYMSYAEKALERSQQLLSSQKFANLKTRYDSLFVIKNKDAAEWK
ncbi:MAG: hypothetical protein EAZ57_04490 [Cytophagales bacterium]|nr:MAG: hypothetical protein EAZ67_05510 [Cytophagales bacterium]TAF61254.1 MAG: hypothetical protein EAZ57_04490 [Cytophagales bacterium]